MNLKKVIRQIIQEEILKESDDGIYYHGSNNKFNEFDLVNNKTYKEFDLPTWHFTKDINYAKRFGKYVYFVNLEIDKTFNTENADHYKLYLDFLREYNNFSEEKIEKILDEQFYNGLPYWTNEDAYYCARSNGFDSILLQEELEGEVLSIAVFDVDQIQILDIKEI